MRKGNTTGTEYRGEAYVLFSGQTHIKLQLTHPSSHTSLWQNGLATFLLLKVRQASLLLGQAGFSSEVSFLSGPSVPAIKKICIIVRFSIAQRHSGPRSAAQTLPGNHARPLPSLVPRLKNCNRPTWTSRLVDLHR